jgi:predicted transcriptional regulator
LKQLVLHKLHEIGMDSFENDERKVLYKIVVDSPTSVAELSDLTDEKESSLRAIITSIRRKMDKDSAQLLFRELS